ncbi:MAG: conjugal transfer protein TraF [Pseudomonadales bacterium]|nr:conjugal transfer protein TraF [Pseudomonadales bacterium]
MLLKILILVLGSWPCMASADLFYDNDPQSWVWYHDDVLKPVRSKPVVKPVPAPTNARGTLRQMGEHMEQAEARAMLLPSDKNIAEALTARRQVLAMAGQYADAFERFIWTHPDFDFALHHAQRSDSLMAVADQQRKDLDQGLAQGALSQGLLYVFRSDCPYCRKFSPLLRQFSSRYGFSVMPLSLDGKGNDEFPFPWQDPAILWRHHLMPEVVPALYLVNPRTDQIQTVGFGLMNWVDLRRRLAVLLGIPLYEGPVSSIHSGRKS